MHLITLLRKDLRCELRSRESLILVLCLALLLAVTASVGLEQSFLTPPELERVFPTVLWLVFLFSATLAVTRSFEYEVSNGAIDGLLLTGVSPGLIFTSKLISNCVVTLLGQTVAFSALTALLNLPYFALLLPILALSAMVTVGYSSLATILTAMTVGSRLRGMLLPLILLPLLFPLLFSALELTINLLSSSSINTASFWFVLLLAFDVVYLTLSFNLFYYVVSEPT